MRPGVEVTIRDSTPPRSAPVDIGAWFVVGITEKGPDNPAQAGGLGEFETVYGGRVTNSVLYDAAETYFREGGGSMVVSRVFGLAPVKAKVTLQDTASSPCIDVIAKGAGAYGNDLDVEVVAGTVPATTVNIIVYDDDVIVERSPDLTSKQAVLDWGQTSAYVNTASGGAGVLLLKVAAKAPLVGGTDDSAAATDATWKTALDKLVKDWGPGQVSMPGRSTSQAHTDTLAHASAMNRVALLDPAVGSDASALGAQGLALRTNVNARYGALFAPWAIVPGLATGTTRTVPFSAVQAALMARTQNANVPAAGENGQARYAIGLNQTFTDAQRQTLMQSGVNSARMIYQGVRSYGYRTLADPLTLKNWLGLNGLRLIMDVKNQAEIIAERYTFRQIDGQGTVLAAFSGALTGMLMSYFTSGQLYGADFEEAAFMDTGPEVNTPATIANGEIRAVIGIKTSPFGELVSIEIVKVGLTESLAV